MARAALDHPLLGDRLLLRLWRPRDPPLAERAYTEHDAGAYHRVKGTGELAGRGLRWAMIDPAEGQLLGSRRLLRRCGT